MPSATVQREIPTVPPPTPPPQPGSDVPEIRGQRECARALRISAFLSEIARTPGCPACETPGPGKSHTRACKAHQDAQEESRQTASAEEANRGVAEDPSSSQMDREPKRTKTATVADAENTPEQMDVDSFQRTLATAYLLERTSDENVSKKARVATNVLHLRGESELKFDVGSLAERRLGDSLKLRRSTDRRAPTNSRLAMNATAGS